MRSHQLPKKQRGFEIQHDAMLLTIFSASNYGGACRNKGGVLIFDEQVRGLRARPWDGEQCTLGEPPQSRAAAVMWRRPVCVASRPIGGWCSDVLWSAALRTPLAWVKPACVVLTCMCACFGVGRQGPAEVKEFYAPPLDQLRAMFEFRAIERFNEQIVRWREDATLGDADRVDRQKERLKKGAAVGQWRHLLVKVNETQGTLSEADEKRVADQIARWSSKGDGIGRRGSADEIGSPGSPRSPKDKGELKDRSASNKTRKAIRKRQLIDHVLRKDASARKNMREGDVVSGIVVVEEDVSEDVTEDEVFRSLISEVRAAQASPLEGVAGGRRWGASLGGVAEASLRRR